MKYTVSEINRLREAIRWSYPTGVSYYPADRDADIERRLTTYMSNGTRPEEFEDELRNNRAEEEKAHRGYLSLLQGKNTQKTP